MKKFLVYFTIIFFLGTISFSAIASDTSVKTDVVVQNETVEITYDELPEAVKTTLQDGEYSNWQIESIFKISSPDASVYYSIEFAANGEKKIVNFDAEGNVVQ